MIDFHRARNGAVSNERGTGALVMAWMPLGTSANLRLEEGAKYPGNLKYSGTM